MTEFTPYLYILMRTDLDSMNAGKAVAQGAHAANLFTYDMTAVPPTDPHFRMYSQWLESGGGFGTTITLDVDARSLGGVYDLAKRANVPTGIVHDSSYPLQDGRVLHLIPLDTCGYVFGDKEVLTPLLSQFGLMR